MLVVFVLDAFDQKPTRPPRTNMAVPAPVVPDAGAALATGIPSRLTQDFQVGPGGIIGTGLPPIAPEPVVAPPRGRGRNPPAPVVLTPERLAADAFIAGRYREAVPLYQALAAANPQNPTFAQILVVLQRRLQTTCRNGFTPEGQACIQ